VRLSSPTVQLPAPGSLDAGTRRSLLAGEVSAVCRYTIPYRRHRHQHQHHDTLHPSPPSATNPLAPPPNHLPATPTCLSAGDHPVSVSLWLVSSCQWSKVSQLALALASACAGRLLATPFCVGANAFQPEREAAGRRSRTPHPHCFAACARSNQSACPPRSLLQPHYCRRAQPAATLLAFYQSQHTVLWPDHCSQLDFTHYRPSASTEPGQEGCARPTTR
jgi:hypothetical protein